MAINIRDNNDPFERYKMPIPELRVSSKGNYSNTTVTNLSKISKSLGTPIECLSKYLGSVLCTQTKWDNKEKTLTVKGTFNKNDMISAIRGYCKKYLLCKRCNAPELNFEIKKKSMQAVCRACGDTFQCDMSDRIHKIMHLNKPAKKIVKKKEPEYKEEDFGGMTSSLDGWSEPVRSTDEMSDMVKNLIR